MIKKVRGGFKLYSRKTGRALSRVTTKAGARRRERQVNYFKSRKRR